MNSSPVFLLLETSNEICSVAVSIGEKIISIRESAEKNSHAQNINLFVEDVLRESKIYFREINAVVVSAGPGSYTGLRIGVSSAKGFCVAQNIPLIAVNTLDSLIAALYEKYTDENVFRCASIHARQNEFYISLQDENGKMIFENEIISVKEFFLKEYSNKKIIFASNEINILQQILPVMDFSFDETITFSAKNLLSVALKKYAENNFAEVASFEPNYIKPVYTN